MSEMLRLVDSIHRDKNIDREVLIEGLEQALASAARKVYGSDEILVTIDRESGKIHVSDGNMPIDPTKLGRIAAQTAKQVMIQKIREAERDVIYGEYDERKGALVTGTVQRFEGGALVVNLGKTEGILPRSEQIPGEVYQPGDRIRVMVLDVQKVGPRVKIVLSRAHPEIVQRLFELEVPEVGERIIEVKGIAREAGQRTKIGVISLDSKVDCVGACVGVRGSRIKNIVDELNGEKIDIVRWNDSPEVLIMASLKPAEIANIELDPENRRARVIVPEDQLSLAIGKKGQNVRLASKLCGWDLDIVSESEAAALPAVEAYEVNFQDVPGIGEHAAEAIAAAGIITLRDVFDAGEKGLESIEGIGPSKAADIVTYTTQLYEHLASEAMAKARAAASSQPQQSARQKLDSLLPDRPAEPEAAPEAPAPEAPAAEAPAAEAPAAEAPAAEEAAPEADASGSAADEKENKE